MSHNSTSVVVRQSAARTAILLAALAFLTLGGRAAPAAPGGVQPAAEAITARKPALPVSWNWSVLGKAPQTYAVPESLKLERPGLRALFYEGLPYQGHPTRVFAWLGIPKHAPGARVPAVVFVHGGGGTAADDVVRLWNERGYACLSMDDVGSYPNAKNQPPDGGPRGNGECFEQVSKPPQEQWMYHAVADVALANSLLRSLPEVDPDKIGLTGLSWGGVVTCVAAGVDNRFRWAAPVYGGGFLGESEFFKPVLEAFGKDRWLSLWGGEHYLPSAKMPMLWIDGTNDDYFQMPATQKSFRLSSGTRTVLLNWRMAHNGWDGAKPPEILAFADSVVRGGPPLPQIGASRRDGGRILVAVRSPFPLVKAELTTTSDPNPRWSQKEWKIQDAVLSPAGPGRTLVSGVLPPGTRAWYVRVADARGLQVSTGYAELPAPLPAPTAVGGPIYAAPQGNDANPGTRTRPVATLAAARDIARTRARTSPVRIVLRAGTYFQASPLELNDADSGTASAPVIWSAAPGEKATVSGGVLLSGWKAARVNGRAAWTLTLPDVKNGPWQFRSLYGPGGRRPRARLPNLGYFTVADGAKPAPGEDTSGDRFTYTPGDLAAWPDLADGEAVLLVQWKDSHLPLCSVSPDTRRVSFTKKTRDGLSKGDRYWIENVRAGLDRPGEWTLSRRTGRLLYLPRPGETPRNTVLIAPRAGAVVNLNGTHDVAFQGLTFSHTQWWFPESDDVWAFWQAASGVPGAVNAANTTHVAFRDCEFSHADTYGAVLGERTKECQVARSRFFDLGGGGARIGPADPDHSPNRTLNAAIGDSVSDCEIYDDGKQFYNAVGIWAGRTQGTQIVHNHIHDLNYSGISSGWSWGFGKDTDTRDVYIAYNLIHDIGRGVLGDGGGIYTLGVQPGTVIENNVVHDVNGTYAMRGVYLDDGSSQITVRGNLLYRNKTANFFQWRSDANRVENNVLALGQDSQIELGGAVFNGGGPSLDFQRNIILVQPGPLLNAFNPSDVKAIYKLHQNLFWNPQGKPAVPENAKAVGWDADSTEADPLFVDLARNNFRLRPGSPALKAIGFVPVDWSQVGPRPR